MFNLNDTSSRLETVKIIVAGTNATKTVLDSLYHENDVIQGLVTPVQKWADICATSGHWPSRILGNGTVKAYGLTQAKDKCSTSLQKDHVLVATRINAMLTDINNAAKRADSVKEVKPAQAAPIAPVEAVAPVTAPTMQETGVTNSDLLDFARNNRISDKAMLSLFGF